MGPYTGKRVPVEGLLYPRYSTVEELLGTSPAAHKASAQPSQHVPAAGVDKASRKRDRSGTDKDAAPAAAVSTPASQADSPGTNAASAAALFAAAEAAAAAGMDPEAVAMLKRRAEKRAKREARRQAAGLAGAAGSPAPAANGTSTPAVAAVQQQQQQACDTAAADSEPQGKAKKAKGRQMPWAEPAAGSGVTDNATAGAAAAAAAAAANAEEAARIRATLGYTHPGSAAPPAAKPAAASQRGAFGFGFTLTERQVNAETEAKIERLMAVDATKDGFVPRRVWACGLPHEYSEEQLREYWEYCGEVESLDLLRFKGTDRFNGAMFVTFKTQEGYKAALAVDGEELEGRKLRVEKCKLPVPKRPKPGSRNSGAVAAAPTDEHRHQSTAPVSSPAAPDVAGADVPRQARSATPGAAHGEYNAVYVGNIAFDAEEDDLREVFQACGVSQVRLHADKARVGHKGFAHVHFNDAAGLAKALELDGTTLGDRPIKVLKAQPPKK